MNFLPLSIKKFKLTIKEMHRRLSLQIDSDEEEVVMINHLSKRCSTGFGQLCLNDKIIKHLECEFSIYLFIMKFLEKFTLKINLINLIFVNFINNCKYI